MFDRTEWRWVRVWTGRIFAVAWLLSIFGLISSGNVMRPGGVIAALPQALLIALGIALPIALIALIGLARFSHRKGGQHESY